MQPIDLPNPNAAEVLRHRNAVNTDAIEQASYHIAADAVGHPSTLDLGEVCTWQGPVGRRDGPGEIAMR